MSARRSLRQFLGRYSLIFIILNVGGLAVSAALLWTWGDASREALRLTEMIATLKEMRGTVYRQVKEAFDARFLADAGAEKQYREFAGRIEQLQLALERLSGSGEEQNAAAAVRRAYDGIAGRTVAVFGTAAESPESLDTELEQSDFGSFEAALADFENQLAARHDQQYRRARTLLTLLPLVLAVPLVTSVVTLFWSRRYLARNIVEPLHQLESQIRALPNAPAPPPAMLEAATEIEHLAQTFARMAVELRDSRQALVRAEKDSALAALVPVLAHNIRNPLASIRAAAQVSDSPALDGDTREALRGIVRTADRIEGWTRTMLSYLAPMQLHMASCDLRSLCDAGLELLASRLADAELTVERSGWGEPCPLQADAVLVEQALHGLLNNAIEASPRGAVIHLALHRSNSATRLTIEDAGPGIPFAPTSGVQMPGPTTKRFGTGLGIPFAIRVFELHHAAVAYERVQPRGTRVSITFCNDGEAGHSDRG
jgi:signal transduction histidine kinase